MIVAVITIGSRAAPRAGVPTAAVQERVGPVVVGTVGGGGGVEVEAGGRAFAVVARGPGRRW